MAKFAAGVVDTGGKFATGGVDTGGNFATGVVDSGGNFANGVVDTGGQPWAANIFTNFEKIRNGLSGMLRDLGETDSWKKTRSKKSRDTVPLNKYKDIFLLNST